MEELNQLHCAEIVIIGLGPGSPDTISLGAFNTLTQMHKDGVPIFARTLIHPTVDWLKTAHGFQFTGSFDGVYESLGTFEQVYRRIASDLIESARKFGKIGYAVPGHPSFSETTVDLIRGKAESENIKLRIVGSQSYIDSVFESEPRLGCNFRVLDALDIIESPDPFKPRSDVLDPSSLHLICQVYDKSIASELKLALLEIYPSDAKICVVTAAGVPDQDIRVSRDLAQLDHSGAEFNHLTSVIVYPLSKLELANTYHSLLAIMARLRNPDGGCPWDLEQTPQTLGKYMIEEAYELVDVLDTNGNIDNDDYVQELGDVLLQVVFHAQIANEHGHFSMHDVIRTLSEKLIRRHPHVFADVDAKTADRVLENWAAIKKTEKSSEGRESILDGVPRSMPALMRAQEISKRAAKIGFEWGSIEGVFEKLDEEIAELRQAIQNKNEVDIESELGDLLFTAVNLGRFTHVDSEIALNKMIERFCARFHHIEQHANNIGKKVDQLSQPEMEAVWQSAKVNIQ